MQELPLITNAEPLSAAIVISVNLTDPNGVGKNIGSVRAEDTPYGDTLQPLGVGGDRIACGVIASLAK